MLAQNQHIKHIADITNQEAKRSAATVALKEEPVSRWMDSFQQYHNFAPWLVAISPDHPNQILGFAKATPYNVREGFNWSVSLSIYVAQEFQGYKIGSALYDLLFNLLRIQGFRHVYARIALPNQGSQYLHERFGLRQSGVLPNFAWKFNQWHNMAIYTGSLSPNDSNQPPKALKSVDEAWRVHTLKLNQLSEE